MDWLKIIDRLNWNNDKEDINFAKDELKKIPDESIPLLVQPLSKFHWENAADVIVSLGIDRCIPIINELFTWIQDLNWPGAAKIYNMLKKAENTLINSYILEALEKAKKEDDIEWLENITMLIEERDIQ